MKKITLDEVRKRCEKYGLKLLDKNFNGNKQKITCVDNYGFKYNFLISALNKGMPRRFGKGNIYTLENIKIFLIINKIPLTLLSDTYDNANYSKLLWRCENGHEIEMTWNSVQSGSLCSLCAKKYRSKEQRTPLQEFERRLTEIHSNKYKVVSGYTKVGAKVKVRCDCGNIWEPVAYSLLQGCGCRKCGYEKNAENRTKTHEEYISEVRLIHENEYEVLGRYTNGDNKILIKHKTCGREYYTQANSLLQGKGCFECGIEKSARKRRKGYDAFVNELWGLVGNEYSVITKDFKIRTEKIEIRHNDCGYVYKVTPQKFLSGRRCPACQESAGESQVRSFLEMKRYYFIPQFAFRDLKSENKLRFDFVVIHEDKILFAIEYDGEQHFKPIEYWGGKEAYEKQKMRDEMKDTYCQKNDIPLIRIPYYTKDIFKALENHISEIDIRL